MCLISVLAAVPCFFNEETDASVGKSIDLPSIIGAAKRFRWMLLIIICCGMQNASFYALGAIYAKAAGMTETDIAIFIGAVLFAPVLTGMPIGALSDRYTRMDVASYISLTAAIVALAMAVASNTGIWVLTTGAGIVGGSMVSMNGLAPSRIVDVMGGDQSVKAATVGLLAYQLGSFSGPILSGILTYSFGSGSLYVAIALFALIAFSATKIGSKPSL